MEPAKAKKLFLLPGTSGPFSDCLNVPATAAVENTLLASQV